MIKDLTETIYKDFFQDQMTMFQKMGTFNGKIETTEIAKWRFLELKSVNTMKNPLNGAQQQL